MKVASQVQRGFECLFIVRLMRCHGKLAYGKTGVVICHFTVGPRTYQHLYMVLPIYSHSLMDKSHVLPLSIWKSWKYPSLFFHISNQILICIIWIQTFTRYVLYKYFLLHSLNSFLKSRNSKFTKSTLPPFSLMPFL